MGRLRCRVAPGPFLCVLGVVLLFAAYFLCSENMLRRYIVGIFLVNSAEKYDLTRGFVLFSERICCYCVPMHVICGFWHMKLAAYLTGNNVALWVILRERKAPGRYFRGSVWAF